MNEDKLTREELVQINERTDGDTEIWRLRRLAIELYRDGHGYKVVE